MSFPRTRTMYSKIPSGGRARRKLLGSWIVDDVQSLDKNSSYARCEDVTDSRANNNPLRIEKYTIVVSPLQGEQGNPGDSNYRQYSNYYPATLLVEPGHVGIPGQPSEGSSMSTAMARTNPGRPGPVSMPVFVGELRDLPHMLRQAGNVLRYLERQARRGTPRRPPRSHEVGGWYLGYQFGWAPLISDLRSMLRFQANVKQRLSELERLYSEGGLKRRIQLYSQTASESSQVPIASNLGVTIFARKTQKTTVRRWATMRWVPTTIPKLNTPADLSRMAQNLVDSPLTSANASDLWNLFPWTWLGDWFFEVDDFINSFGNRLPAECKGGCVMTHTSTHVSFSRIPDAHTWVTGGYASHTKDTKVRYVGGQLLNFSMPFLDGRQTSILSALAINRNGRSGRYIAR